MTTTWSEVARRSTVQVTFAVAGAPLLTVGPATVRPAFITVWIIDGVPTATGWEGDIEAGPGSKSGGRMASTTPLTEAPEWVQGLVRDTL